MGFNLSEWKSKGSFFNYLGHQIFYQDSDQQGKPLEKPCLTCLHGFPASSWDWRELWAELAENYRVIAIDMLGFGFSDKPHEHIYSVTEQATILEGLLQHLNIRDYHLIAHDFGTLVAQELLSRQHQRTKTNQPSPDNNPELLSLFAMSGSIFPELSNPRLIQKLLISPLGPWITRLFNEKKFYRNLERVFGPSTLPTNETLNTYWQQLIHHQGHKQLHRLNFFLKDRKLHGDRWAESWQNTEVPVRYVAGESDPMYGQDGINSLKALSNQKDIHTVPAVGHFPHVESASKVLTLLTDFINNNANQHLAV